MGHVAPVRLIPVSVFSKPPDNSAGNPGFVEPLESVLHLVPQTASFGARPDDFRR